MEKAGEGATRDDDTSMSAMLFEEMQYAPKLFLPQPPPPRRRDGCIIMRSQLSSNVNSFCAELGDGKSGRRSNTR